MSETATAEALDPELDAPAVEEPAKAVPPSLGRFGLQESHNQIWRLNVPVEVTAEQCMDEGFWAHLALHLRPGDEIRVFPDDMTWELVLHVVDQGKSFAHVVKKVLYRLAATTGKVELPSLYKVDFAGTTHRYRVIRDGKMLRDGFATEPLARRWAANHEAAVNR